MSTTTTPPTASWRSSNYARDAVFAAFQPRQARALDQGDFVDRAPEQLPRRRIETDAGGEIALDRLAEVLLLDAEQETL